MYKPYSTILYFLDNLQIVVEWDGHFANEFHRTHKLLNEIEPHVNPLTAGRPYTGRIQATFYKIVNNIVNASIDSSLFKKFSF